MKNGLYRKIVDESLEPIIATDREGRIILWNSGAVRTFGYDVKEAMGKSLDLIIPEKHRDRHWKGYRRVMDTGRTVYGGKKLNVPSLSKGGDRVFLEFTIVLIPGERESPVAVAAVMHDMTDHQHRS